MLPKCFLRGLYFEEVCPSTSFFKSFKFSKKKRLAERSKTKKGCESLSILSSFAKKNKRHAAFFVVPGTKNSFFIRFVQKKFPFFPTPLTEATWGKLFERCKCSDERNVISFVLCCHSKKTQKRSLSIFFSLELCLFRSTLLEVEKEVFCEKKRENTNVSLLVAVLLTFITWPKTSTKHVCLKLRVFQTYYATSIVTMMRYYVYVTMYVTMSMLLSKQACKRAIACSVYLKIVINLKSNILLLCHP